MKRIIPLLIILLFLVGTGVFAQEISSSVVSGAELPDPGLTPDSQFYFLKTWKEQIQMFFTFGEENKAKQFLHLAEVRLAEYQKMMEMEKTEIAQKTLDKYEKQLNQAVEKAQEVQKKGGEDLTDTIKEKRVKYQEVLGGILEKVPAETKEGIISERREKWTGFITEVHEKFPTLIPEVVGGEVLSVKLFNCPVPLVPAPEDCEAKWQIDQSNVCPYFKCPTIGKTQPVPPPEKAIEQPRARESIKPSEPAVCVQVITPAVSPLGTCREFPTPCDVPADWKKVDKCPGVIESKLESSPNHSYEPPTISFPSMTLPELISPTPTLKSAPAPATAECQQYQLENRPCPDSGGKRVYECICREGKWSCPSLETACPKPTELRYYTCPDGTRVVSGECFGESGKLSCIISSRPEIQCPQITPPVTRRAVCSTVGETNYYQCSDGTKIPWCMCLVSGGEWADPPTNTEPVNRWQCQYYSVGFTCSKQAATPVTAPSSASTPSATEPVQQSYVSCNQGGVRDHKCSDGTMVGWQCQCFSHNVSITSADYHYDCDLEPAKSCTTSTTPNPLTVTWINIRLHEGGKFAPIFWKTNIPALSYIEYGPTTSYGFRAGGLTAKSGNLYPPDTQFVVEGQGLTVQPDTTYHFRVVADDTKGNTFTSQDYTFTTGF